MKIITAIFALTAVITAAPCSAQSNVIHHRKPYVMSPALAARLARDSEMERAGHEALRNGDFVAAEADFRESINASPWARGYFGLGEALAGQGRTEEAIAVYRSGIYGPPYTVAVLNDIPLHGQFNPNVRECPGAAGAEAWMKYALLLSQTGLSPEAIVIYQKALPQVPAFNEVPIDCFPGNGAPSLTGFQAAIHVALGLCAAHGGDNTVDTAESQYLLAMQEYQKALQLAPESALTNYYYGDGWEYLAPADQAKFGTVQQAKAALQKAVKFGKGEVRIAAQRALQIAMKPK